MKITTKRNYYLNIFIIVLSLAIVAAITEIFRPSIYITTFIFIIFIVYFFLNRQTESLIVDGDKITITYFQFLKRFRLTSELSKIKISSGSQVSYRSSIKKFTLSVTINQKHFDINTLDGFNEDDLISFYNFYSSHSTV